MYDSDKASTKLNEEPMESVNSYKYLGVTLTSKLTWSDHVSNITGKVRRLIGVVYTDGPAFQSLHIVSKTPS